VLIDHWLLEAAAWPETMLLKWWFWRFNSFGKKKLKINAVISFVVFKHIHAA
jgi:hypothetical protein